MLVLGIQGSPRKNGNTAYILSIFMQEAKKLGAEVCTINIDDKNINPCKEYKLCETKGYCPIDDDMKKDIYPLLWKADLIVLATPVFFYSVPAQLKALIDRSQTQWARKHIHKLEDPGRKWRKGFVLSLGATKGENLFEGINLTSKYFFDAVGAQYKGMLSYRKIENPGDFNKFPEIIDQVKRKAAELIEPSTNRKKIIFACKENSCRSQMAQAFAQFYAGDKIESFSGGDFPAESINKIMKQVMEEKGLDMEFKKPVNLKDIPDIKSADVIVTMGCDVACSVYSGVKIIKWDLPNPSNKTIEFMRDIRDNIEKKIIDLIDHL